MPCGSDQIGEAGGEGGGLPGACACEDEHRALGREHGFPLRRVEAGEIGGLATRRGRVRQVGRRFRHLLEVGKGERNGNHSGDSRRFPKGSNGCSQYPRYPQAWSRIFRFPDSESRCIVHG